MSRLRWRQKVVLHNMDISTGNKFLIDLKDGAIDFTIMVIDKIQDEILVKVDNK